VAGPKVHQLEERAKAAARDLATGCGHGDHHEGCGHRAATQSSGIRVSQPTDAAERLADGVADRMDSGVRVTGARRGSAHRADGPLAQALRPAGPGRPLEADLRRDSEASLGADLSHVRVHDDHRSDALSRHLGADGFSVGGDVYFRHGVYGSAASHDRHIVNHELAHASGGGAGSQEVISRHASWEHRMLGDVDPAVLEVIASGRDMVEDRKSDKKATPSKTIQGTDPTGQTRTIGPDDVLHALEQEIERQQLFAKMQPAKRGAAATGKNEAKITKNGIVDQKWEVSIVNIPLRDGRVAALTYGEMNTLGDFYGSPEEIGQTDPQQFLNYLYGIREEGIRKFMRLHTEIAKGLGKKSKYDGNAGKNKVKDKEATSQGNTGTWAMIDNDSWGEVKLMGAGLTKGEKKKRAKTAQGDELESTGYTGGLGRNACHFAPQSWHAWSSYHQKAKAIADEAYLKREAAKVSTKPNEKAKLEQEADAKENEALVQNGFGDHFLQDSFASGHLINKTLIMQWFVKWMDEHPFKRDYSNEEDWQRVQNIAYGQSGLAAMPLYSTPLKQGQASDAQSVDNMGGSWQDRFDALGLEIPKSVRSGDDPAGKLLLGWQEQRRLGKLKSTDVTAIKKTYAGMWGLADGEVETALKLLINDGVVRYSHYSTSDRKKGPDAIGLTGTFGAKSLELTKGYEPGKVKKKKSGDKAPKTVGQSDVQKDNEAKLGQRAQKVTYQDYMAFLNHGYMQLSTNMLHNHFCENGLTVKSAAATLPYKIYGDNNMLQAESAKGVRFSAETSNMSRDAIYDWATTGNTFNATATIESRLPKTVVDSTGTEVSLANWHGDNGELHKLCWDKVFPATAAFFSKSTFIASDALVSTKAQEKIMKDVKILQHDGEGF
jgi:hypothetical protein